ncbi:MAG TPA: glycosyltransferase family 4 protein [Pirellulales bacterium]|jgi:glycosyltransferase involved in cell wall biosynthesis|nr:glycosyltransferase family 4 protein [Pirellulales bacterium]
MPSQTIVERSLLPAGGHKIRLAMVVSHPIQYYAPLYRRLAQRDDLDLRVFFTWFGQQQAVWDKGFEREFAWDIPLVDGYPFEAVPNRARDPGTHHFFGIDNPGLPSRLLAWRPDVVHLTGYAFAGHLRALRALARRGVPVLFRGDSHLLGRRGGWKQWLRKLALRQIFRWPAGFLYVGKHNRDYYRAFGVPESKLFYCPHSIELERFAERAEEFEIKARQWRWELGIDDDRFVLVFAGKLQAKKQPVELMRAVAAINDPRLVLVVVGDGPERPAVDALAAQYPDRFRLLPFQNQSVMPIVYRLGEVFVLPSQATDETWGLAVNEAMACSRAVVASDLVGCVPELVHPGSTGEVFQAGDWEDFREKMQGLIGLSREGLAAIGSAARELAGQFTPKMTETHLLNAVQTVLADKMNFTHSPAVPSTHQAEA